MAFILKRDGWVGWEGTVGATVHIEARVDSAFSQLIGVHYNGQPVPYQQVSDKVWSLQFDIVAGNNRIIFAFATPAPDNVEIVEIVAAPVAPAVAPAVLVAIPPAAPAAPAAPVAGIVPAVVAAANEQEIAGCTHAMTPFLSPLIEGV
jgi:hypothetical protein